ncbi:LLM class flavin-dependent oxidoreductase [Halorarius litoreus]|uniref:LLM class flavin-dependent oxidoreductase n=1 Tax=Halorarius litoreus TaxID=2962676 RepID=UPI0020CDB833|nr:LLM class flavin-dependent oxidoreductase [Halorarius litoreus]
MSRTGVLFALTDDLDLVRDAESFGYESVWSAEGQGKTAFGKLERWATATENIQLATGIVNVFSRTPAALAQATATLDDHSNGRAILGLGVAHPGVVEDFHGAEFDRPLRRLHEYVELVRRYLRGEASSFDGEFFSPERTSFWEAFEPVRAEVPIYNAALGPANVRLTGQVADGWLPNLFPMDGFDEALGWLETGAERVGRSLDDVDVAMYVLTVPDADPEAARRRAAEHIAYYIRDIPGYYDRPAEKAGFADEVAAVKAASSTPEGAAEISDAFVDTLAVAGTPDDCRDRIDQLRAAGVDLPIVRAPTGASRELERRVLETFAPEP